jgi:hypothetical protein
LTDIGANLTDKAFRDDLGTLSQLGQALDGGVVAALGVVGVDAGSGEQPARPFRRQIRRIAAATHTRAGQYNTFDAG